MLALGFGGAAAALSGAGPGGPRPASGGLPPESARRRRSHRWRHDAEACACVMLVHDATEFLLLDYRIAKTSRGHSRLPLRRPHDRGKHAEDCQPLQNGAVDSGTATLGVTLASRRQQPASGPPPEGGRTRGSMVAASARGRRSRGRNAGPSDGPDVLARRPLTNADGARSRDVIRLVQGRALHMHRRSAWRQGLSDSTRAGTSPTPPALFPNDVPPVRPAGTVSSHGDVPLVPAVRDASSRAGALTAHIELTPIRKDGRDGFVARIVLGVDPNATPDPRRIGLAEDSPVRRTGVLRLLIQTDSLRGVSWVKEYSHGPTSSCACPRNRALEALTAHPRPRLRPRGQMVLLPPSGA